MGTHRTHRCPANCSALGPAQGCSCSADSAKAAAKLASRQPATAPGGGPSSSCSWPEAAKRQLCGARRGGPQGGQGRARADPQVGEPARGRREGGGRLAGGRRRRGAAGRGALGQSRSSARPHLVRTVRCSPGIVWWQNRTPAQRRAARRAVAWLLQRSSKPRPQSRHAKRRACVQPTPINGLPVSAPSALHTEEAENKK